MATNKAIPVKLKVKIPENVKGGTYANVFNLTTTAGGEVFIDFIFYHPNDRDKEGTQTGTVVSRIAMTTGSAIQLKMLLEAQLGKNRKE